jgi:hypothetical protein
VVFRITGSVVMETGVKLFQSWRTAVQRMPWLALKVAVVSTRADPLVTVKGRLPSTTKGSPRAVEKVTVPPGATDTEVAEASFRAAPPAGPKTSMPTITGELNVFVHMNKGTR